MKRLINIHSLPVQIIISFFLLVLLTTIAIGLPAFWLIHNQLDHAAWAQINQGTRAVRALYTSQQNEVTNLATLTAQRPTLHQLLIDENQESLKNYFRDLQNSVGIDFVIVCASENMVTLYPEKISLSNICQIENVAGYYLVTEEGFPQVWMLSSHSITEAGNDIDDVIIGIVLDDEFATQIHEQTGLEHTILVNDQPVATSFPIGIAGITNLTREFPDTLISNEAVTSIFNLGRQSYYAARLPLEEQSIVVEVALDVSDIATSQRRIIFTLFGSISVVAVIASGFGVLLARRISQPLVHLADAATALSRGDLTPTINIETQVHEVKLVAQSLEDARIDLKQTLSNLNEEKEWGEHLLESIVEGIITLDQQNRITYVSLGAERITGWEKNHVLHRHIDEVFKLAQEHAPFSKRIPLPGQKQNLSVLLSNQRQATLAITGAELMPPEVGGARIALVFRDISEEEAIHRLLGHFMSNVAHEFRTPLSALAASGELLLDQGADLQNEEAQELINSLHLGILGLERLIDNLLESASIEAGNFQVSTRPSDLGNIIAEAIQTMEPLLKKYHQRLVIQLPSSIPLVQADPRRTIQVLINLISNANKFGPAHSEIGINATVIENFIRVAVTDRGQGIPLDQREGLFHRFVRRAIDDSKAKAGAGLGLSVVKAIVEMQGGRVGIEDCQNGGITFWFTIPLVSEL